MYARELAQSIKEENNPDSTTKNNNNRNNFIMKQQLLKSFMLRAAMLVAILCSTFASTVWADEVLVYTLTPASGSNSNYASNCNITINDVTWNLTGNSQIQPWRIGGRSLDKVERTLYSKTAIPDNISKIEVTHESASSITVHSWVLYVASDADFTNTVSAMQLDFAPNSTTTITRPEDKDWSNCYYKFVYKVTVSSTSNKFIEFTNAKFYKETDTSLTESDLEVSSSALTFDLYNNADAQTVSYTTSSTGIVTVSGGEGYVTTSVNGNTITVTPTAVTPSAQTITVSQAADDTYAAGTATFTVSVDDSTPFTGGDVSFDATKDIGTNDSGSGSITKQVVTMSCTNCNLSDGTAYRLYSKSTTTFTTTQGKIKKIVFTMASGYNSTLLSTTTGSYSNGTWTGSASSIAFSASAQARASKIVVTVAPDDAVAEPSIAGTISFLDNTEVTITAEEGATIYYTIDGSTPTTSSTQYAGAFTVMATTTVKAIAVKDGNISNAAEQTFTKVTPIDVATALTTADNTEVYVQGIVSAFYNTSIVGDGTNYRYYISDDGTTTNQLLIYKGKGLNNVAFSSADDLQIGDVVVVYGTMTTYNNTKEVNAGNYIISLTTKANSELSFATTEYTVAPGADFTAPTLTNPHNLTVTYASSDEDLALVDESTGEVLIGDDEGTVTITASFAGNETYRAGSASYTITIVDNTKGTLDNPYTVAEVSAGKASGKTEVYVKGFIVGSWKNSKFDKDNLVDTNLALADSYDSDETIPVELPSTSSNTVRTDWGPASHVYNNGVAQVVLKGKGEDYFSKHAIKGTTEIVKVAEHVTVTSAGYATYYTDCDLDFTDTGIAAYAGTLNGSSLTFSPVSQVPAGNGVLLVAADGKSAVVPVTESATDISNNCMQGTLAGTTLTEDDYILNVVGGRAGFYKAGSSYTALGAHKAYIPAQTGNVKGFVISLEDDATGIKDLNLEDFNGFIYNLAGQRLEKMQKGINIVNGKKILK